MRLLRPAPLVLGLVCLLLLPAGASAPAHPTPRSPLSAADYPVESGDLVFRRGATLLSRTVYAADPQGRYSHVGIVWLDADGNPWAIHAAPAEGGRPGGVHLQPLDAFLAGGAAEGFALYRLAAPAELRHAAAENALGYHRRHAPFDASFDLAEASAVYCTELVWRAYLEQGVDLARGGRDHVKVLFADLDCILPSRLSADSRLRRLHPKSPERRS
jgi:hypothetical protein